MGGWVGQWVCIKSRQMHEFQVRWVGGKDVPADGDAAVPLGWVEKGNAFLDLGVPPQEENRGFVDRVLHGTRGFVSQRLWEWVGGWVGGSLSYCSGWVGG